MGRKERSCPGKLADVHWTVTPLPPSLIVEDDAITISAMSKASLQGA